MNKKDLIIYGAGGHARVVFEIAELTGQNITAFVDKNTTSKSFFDLPLFTPEEMLIRFNPKEHSIFVAIGNNAARKKIMQTLAHLGYEFPYLIHPSAVISKRCLIGAGTVVMPNATINSNSSIGVGVIINTGVIIDHDCKVGDYTIINQRATLCGGASVGNECHIEAGTVIEKLATVRDNTTSHHQSVILATRN